MREIEFVALDCETTGLNSEKDNLIELGAVKFSISENLDSFDSLFCSPTRIPQFVERLTGIQNSDLVGAPKFSEKQEEFQKFCEGKILLGHNLRFDLDFLAAAGLDLNSYLSLDTFRIAGLLLPRGDSLSLENLSQKFGVTHDNAHRALADAEATRDLLRVFFRIAKSFPRKRWEKIVNLPVRQAGLDSTVRNWVQDFAKLVLDSKVESLEHEVAKLETPEIREVVVEKLFNQFSRSTVPQLIEVSANPIEILTAAKKLGKPAAVFFANNFVAQGVSEVAVFSPKNYVDTVKLENFVSQKLSETEVAFAAKLILHTKKNFREINFTRGECLLFDFVSAEKPEKSLPEFFVSDHVSLPEFQNFSHLKIITDAISLPENLARENSVILDFSTLEELSPSHLEKLQIWWGILGLLFREAAPQFGSLNFAEATFFSNFSKAVEAGKSFLAVAGEKLPPKIVVALENFLATDSNFRKSLRSNAAGEMTLIVESFKVALPDFSDSILLDAAADAGDDFAFAKRTLDLPENFLTEKFDLATCSSNLLQQGDREAGTEKDLPRFLVAEDSPNPATPQFFFAVEKFLLKNLPQFLGVTAVVFPNRMEAGNFAERATAELDFPVFFRKIPSFEKLAVLEKAVIILTTGSQFFPPKLHNFVSVKLPFIVRDGADWNLETLPATVLRFKKMWSNFASSPVAEKFIALDSRLIEKKYGQNFLDVIPQKFESVRISE